jgi:hypothetical protein
MPDYASSRGLAGFFDTLSKEFMDSKRQEYQNEAKIKELTTENTLEAMKQGKIQYQPQAPVASPLNLTGTPTISGSMAPPAMPVPAPTAPSMAGVGGIAPYFSSPQVAGAMPGLNVAPPVPKTQPLTLQQQNELIGSTMKGQPAADRYVTVKPEQPEGSPTSVEVGAGGNITSKKYDYLAREKAGQTEAYRKEQLKNNAKKIAQGASKTDSPKVAALKALQSQYAYDWMYAKEDEKDAIQTKIDNIDVALAAYAGVPESKVNPPGPATDALPAGVTEQDITHTMKTRKMTRQQVLDAFNKKNKVK